MTAVLIFGLCVNVFNLDAQIGGPMDVGRAEAPRPNVRLRPDGVVERFDWNVFHFVPTQSRFVPVRPKVRRSAEPRVQKFQPAERFMRILPKSEDKRPQNSTIPGLFDT